MSGVFPILLTFQAALFLSVEGLSAADSGLVLQGRIGGNISPKSIIYAGNGLFFAQNMMYRHTVTVYGRDRQLRGTVSDRVPGPLIDPAQPAATYRGAPVEAAPSHGGKFVWVTNYFISGPGFASPGNDTCENDPRPFDDGFLYRIDVARLEIDRAVRVGPVPKVVAVTPDDRYALVSNWCGGSVSVIDLGEEREVRRVRIGRYPRGIAVDRESRRAYIAVMGSYDIAVLDLTGFRLSWLRGIGRSPRHLVLHPDGRYLFASLSGEDRVVKVDLATGAVAASVATGIAPRSMAIAPDGRYLYVASYESNTLSKVRTRDFVMTDSVSTDHHPIGVAVDPETRHVWVACYSGTIMIFQDTEEQGRTQ